MRFNRYFNFARSKGVSFSMTAIGSGALVGIEFCGTSCDRSVSSKGGFPRPRRAFSYEGCLSNT